MAADPLETKRLADVTAKIANILSVYNVTIAEADQLARVLALNAMESYHQGAVDAVDRLAERFAKVGA